VKIHIDIDCFFVSAARIVEPALYGKCVAIGGRSDTKIFTPDAKKQVVNFENSGSFVPIFYKAYDKDDIETFKDKDGRVRGILTTASYEARAYGVKTTMSIVQACHLCPELIIKAPNMSLYQELSHKLHEYLSLKIPMVEQASIDEFYGDLEGWVEDEDVPRFIENLKEEIKRDINLPVSIGAAQTKYIAKLATTYAKPFGCKCVYKESVEVFVHPIKIENFAGIGKSMQKKLKASHIYTLGELLQNRGRVESFGPYAKELYKRVKGESDANLKPSQTRKSIGISRTFDPIFNRNELKRRVHVLARHLSFAIEKLSVIPTLFHLSISYELNQNSHKNISIAELFTEQKFDALCLKLFTQADIERRLKIIRISINCSSFTRDSKKELSLIGFAEDKKMRQLSKNIHVLREKYGIDVVKFASEFYI